MLFELLPYHYAHSDSISYVIKVLLKDDKTEEITFEILQHSDININNN